MPRLPIAACLALTLVACATSAPREPAPEPERDFVVLPLEHAAAAELGRELREVLADSPTLRILSDERTNSLVVSGTQADIARVRELAQRLDRKVEGG